MINNHLGRHLASPYASGAFVLVCSRCKSPMTAFPVDWKRRWNAAPRGRRCFFSNLASGDFQIADLIKFNGLKTRIGNRQPIPGYRVTGPEVMFSVSAFSHADEEFSGLTSDTASNR
jgi:hypothetical protein